MNRLLAMICTGALATLLVACTQKNAQTSGGTGKADNVATVDGRAITRSTFNEYAKAVANKSADELTPPQRQALLDNLLRGEVLAKEAETSGVAAQDSTRAQLDLHRLEVLTRAQSEHYLKDRKATEAEMRAEYDSQVAGIAKAEYRARHILVPTEESARQAIAELKAGGDFAKLARKLSTDKGTAELGGDLAWFAPASMTPAFADAVMKLKKGETTAAPVQTEYGWHVIQVTDTRPIDVPAYESVKEKLATIVENKRTKAYVDGLLAKAKITKSL